MKQTNKPVHNCHGCGLNFGDHCGVYECPHDMWHHRKCPGWRNEALLKEYEDRATRAADDARKEKRKEVARMRSTEDHHQGTRHRNGTMAVG